MPRRWFALTALTVLAALGLNGAVAAGSNVLSIRVLVASGARQSLAFYTPHTAYYADGSVLTRSSLALEWRLSLSQKGTVAVEAQGGTLFDTGRDRLLLGAAGSGGFTLAGKTYRGTATVIARASSLSVVNTLDVEEYVRGVLPVEMPAGWPEEALRAQAVIARTYAISRLNGSGDFDVCATTACQVYGGAGVETGRTDAAAAATRGIIAAWGNKPAKTVFHADSGGYTASAREVWGESVPYLVARPDPLSRSPRSPWRVAPTPATIAAVLARLAPAAGAYGGLAVTARTESGRVDGLEVAGSRGTVRLRGQAARDLVRALGAQSTLAGVTSSQPLVLSGTGWGHGVGLSQWGAKGLAESGWRYDQILGYYYPGISLANYEVVF